MEYVGICAKSMPKKTTGNRRDELEAWILITLIKARCNEFLSILEETMPRDIALIITQYAELHVQLPDSKPRKVLAKQNSLWLQRYISLHRYKEYTSRVVTLFYELGHYLNQDDASLVFEYLEDRKDFEDRKDSEKVFKQNFVRIPLVDLMFYMFKGEKYRWINPEDVIVRYELALPMDLNGRNLQKRNKRRRKALELYMLLYGGTPHQRH